MAKAVWREPSQWDALAGDSQPRDEAPRKTYGNRSQRQGSQPKFEPRQPRNQRPAEVSEMVWGLAEQWLEQGTATFGTRPPVNLPEFSKRLSERINDRQFTGTEPDEVNEIVSVMAEKFWASLEAGDKNTGTVQFKFLRDEWEGLMDQAKTAIRVKWLKKHGVKVRPPEYPQKGENAYDRVIEKQKLDRIIADTTEPPPPRTGSVKKPRKRNT